MVDFQTDLNRFYNDLSQEHERLYELANGDLCVVRHEQLWYRGRVQSTDKRNKSANVLLVDFGQFEKVSFRGIRVISTYFASFGPFSFPCRMTRLNNDESCTDDELILRFLCICHRAANIQIHYLTNEMPYLVRILVSEFEGRHERNDAYILSPSYAVLAVEKIECRLNWIASPNVVGQQCHGSVLNKKIEVNIASIRSPSELYVTPRRFNTANRKLHATIQRLAIKHQTNACRGKDKRWQIGDQCLVQVRRSGDIEMWYRGRIDGLDDDQNQFHIFLRDFGDVVSVNAEKLMQISIKLQRKRDSVIRCHLDGVNSWLPSSIGIFQSLLGDGHASFAPRANGSVPITLWRPTLKTACGVIVEWENMNRWLVTATVIEVSELYIRTTQDEFRAGEWPEILKASGSDHYVSNSCTQLFDLDSISLGDDTIDTRGNKLIDYYEYDDGALVFRLNEAIFYELDDWIDGEVNEWLPAEQIERLTFNGTPVYIDLNGVLYIHDSYRKYLAQHMSAFITRTIENDENALDPFAINWTVGQACFAKFDEHFYRGILQNVDHAKCVCMVKFIDYGNYDLCKFEEMRPATKFGHIPILVQKYCLDNVWPISGDNRWPLATVNFMRTKYVERLCSLHVRRPANQDASILPCSILCIGNKSDMKEQLIAMNLAYERAIPPQQHL